MKATEKGRLYIDFYRESYRDSKCEVGVSYFLDKFATEFRLPRVIEFPKVMRKYGEQWQVAEIVCYLSDLSCNEKSYRIKLRIPQGAKIEIRTEDRWATYDIETY